MLWSGRTQRMSWSDQRMDLGQGNSLKDIGDNLGQDLCCRPADLAEAGDVESALLVLFLGQLVIVAPSERLKPSIAFSGAPTTRALTLDVDIRLLRREIVLDAAGRAALGVAKVISPCIIRSSSASSSALQTNSPQDRSFARTCMRAGSLRTGVRGETQPLSRLPFVKARRGSRPRLRSSLWRVLGRGRYRRRVR